MAFNSSRRKQQFRKKGDSSATTEDNNNNNTSTDAIPPTTPTHSNPPSTTSTPSSTPIAANVTNTPTSAASTPTSTPTNGVKAEKKESAKPKPTLLSFGDEEEEEFQVKKTSVSKKMTKEIKENKTRPFLRELPPVVSTATAAMSGGAGEYTPEKLQALRKNAMAYNKPKEETPIPAEADIPSDKQIQAARERRKGIREGKDGFIPLEEGGKAGGRLVREGEGDDDDADEEGRGDDTRIDMAGIKKGGKGGKGEVIEVDDDVEDDEELRRWEMDRIRKGVGAQEMKRKDLENKARTQKSPGRSPGLDLTRKSTITIESITKDIKVTLKGLQDAHRSHATQLDRIKEELRNAQEASKSMEEQVKEGADEYSFFAAMKIYVADLLDCLGAKAELVEQAEDKQLAAYRVRNAKNRAHAQRKIEATAQEMKEVAEEAAGYGKGTTKTRAKAEPKKQRARGEEEGWSSDSESEEVNMEFTQAEGEARAMGTAVFEDVDEKYSTIRAIKEKFEEWKKDYSNSYKQAYISLSMPQLFSPFVRLQLLAREPLRDGLDGMDWYKDLFDYGMNAGEAVEDDEDNFLVPRLVEKVVIPRVQDALTHVWNPQSKKSNARALAAVQEVLVYTDAFAPHTKELMAGVLGGLQNVAAEVRIPMYHFPKDKDFGSQQPWEFSCRMMWRTIKLLKNVTAWHEVLAAVPLQNLAIDNLITSKLLPFVRTLRDSNTSLFLDAYESIVDCLPPAWTLRSAEEETDGRSPEGVPQNLVIFHDPLLTVTRKLAEEDRRERNNKDSNKEREKERERMIGRACRVLIKLGDKENGNLIARATSIKLT